MAGGELEVQSVGSGPGVQQLSLSGSMVSIAADAYHSVGVGSELVAHSEVPLEGQGKVHDVRRSTGSGIGAAAAGDEDRERLENGFDDDHRPWAMLSEEEVDGVQIRSDVDDVLGPVSAQPLPYSSLSAEKLVGLQVRIQRESSVGGGVGIPLLHHGSYLRSQAKSVFGVVAVSTLQSRDAHLTRRHQSTRIPAARELRMPDLREEVRQQRGGVRFTGDGEEQQQQTEKSNQQGEAHIAAAVVSALQYSVSP